MSVHYVYILLLPNQTTIQLLTALTCFFNKKHTQVQTLEASNKNARRPICNCFSIGKVFNELPIKEYKNNSNSISSPESKCKRASHSYNIHKTLTAAMIDPFPTRINYAHVKTMFLNWRTEGSIH